MPAWLLLAGCGRRWQSWYLSRTDNQIRRATTAIESAGSDAQRAAAYADRGEAYGEKARYSRAFKLISSEEYNRLFDLAVQDGGRARSIPTMPRCTTAAGIGFMTERHWT